MPTLCKICNDEGITRDDKGNPILCECVKRKRLINLYKEIGLPLKFIDFDLTQYTIKQDAYGKDIDPKSEKQKIIAKNVISGYIDSLPGMIEGYPFIFEKDDCSFKSFTLLLSGKQDSGKSMLAASIIKGALKYNIRPYYLEWSEIINACFDYYSDASSKNKTKIEKYESIIQVVEDSKLLIIENLDKLYENNKYNEEDRLTANVRRQTDAMFSIRVKKSFPTVITTNQNIEELTSEVKYGPVLVNLIDDSIKLELPTLGRSKRAIDIKIVNR